MKGLLKLISFAALAATLVPSILAFFGELELDVVKGLALVGTAIWFITSPLWMGKELPVDSREVEI